MRSEGDWDRLIEGLRQGDEAVMTDFVRDWGGALERVADRHIAQGMRRRFGPESIVQSACRSFLRRAREDAYELSGSGDLWRLMCAITLRKVREQARFHMRQRRGIDREVSPSGAEGQPRDETAEGPTPDEALEVAEQFEVLLGSLEEEERRIVDLKLQERSNDDVAAELGCSERTVRRLLAQLRERLEEALAI